MCLGACVLRCLRRRAKPLCASAVFAQRVRQGSSYLVISKRIERLPQIHRVHELLQVHLLVCGLCANMAPNLMPDAHPLLCCENEKSQTKKTPLEYICGHIRLVKGTRSGISQRQIREFEDATQRTMHLEMNCCELSPRIFPVWISTRDIWDKICSTRGRECIQVCCEHKSWSRWMQTLRYKVVGAPEGIYCSRGVRPL